MNRIHLKQVAKSLRLIGFTFTFFYCGFLLADINLALDEIKFDADIYAAHENMASHKGYQDDISSTFHLKYPDFSLAPFIRFSTSHYYYLNEDIPGTTAYATEHRSAAGVGLDYYVKPYLRLRYIYDNKTDNLKSITSQQESYIIIYNQYLEFENFHLNNYGEAAIIPRLSTKKFNSFLRSQVLKQFDINRTKDHSNVIYPFLQIKIKDNEEELFGASGNHASVGLGFKNYTRLDGRNTLAFLLQAHSLLYQTSKFNGDWMQILAVIQYGFK